MDAIAESAATKEARLVVSSGGRRAFELLWPGVGDAARLRAALPHPILRAVGATWRPVSRAVATPTVRVEFWTDNASLIDAASEYLASLAGVSKPIC